VVEASPTARNTGSVWLWRAMLVAGAGVALWQGQLAFNRFTLPTLGFAWGTWALAMVLIAVGAALFTLAARIPFSPQRLSWGPMVLALVAALPIARFVILWVGPQRHWHLPAPLTHLYWIDGDVAQFVAPALVGVALAFAIAPPLGT
jgi:hypothetical protein